MNKDYLLYIDDVNAFQLSLNTDNSPYTAIDDGETDAIILLPKAGEFVYNGNRAVALYRLSENELEWFTDFNNAKLVGSPKDGLQHIQRYRDVNWVIGRESDYYSVYDRTPVDYGEFLKSPPAIHATLFKGPYVEPEEIGAFTYGFGEGFEIE